MPKPKNNIKVLKTVCFIAIYDGAPVHPERTGCQLLPVILYPTILFKLCSLKKGKIIMFLI